MQTAVFQAQNDVDEKNYRNLWLTRLFDGNSEPAQQNLQIPIRRVAGWLIDSTLNTRRVSQTATCTQSAGFPLCHEGVVGILSVHAASRRCQRCMLSVKIHYNRPKFNLHLVKYVYIYTTVAT